MPHPNARIAIDVVEWTIKTRYLSLRQVGVLMHNLSVAAVRGEWENITPHDFVIRVRAGSHAERPPIPPELRRAVLRRDGERCRHCGGTERLQLDHIHPWSKGGKHTMRNLQVLCSPCNARKGARV